MRSLLIFFLALVISSQAYAADVACGLDSDHDGIITLCTNGDNDRDGFTVAQGDCDDTDPNYYPGRGRATGCSTNEAKNCPLSGSGVETACSSGGWKPEKCTNPKYIATTGNNSNAGTVASPWANYLNFVSYYNVGDRPATYYDMAAGDCFVFRAGTYTNTYTYDVSTMAFFLRGRDATVNSPIQVVAFPGERVIFRPGVTAPPVTSIQGDYNWFIGFEISTTNGVGTYSGNNGAMNLTEAVGGKIDGLTISGINGNQAGNLAGIHTNDADDVQITNNKIWDVYDQTNDAGAGTSENNSGIVDFNSNNAYIRRNHILYTATGRANCIKKKHTNETVTTRADIGWNYCYQTVPDLENYAFGFSGSVYLHHNWVGGLPAASDALEFRDFGGSTNFSLDTLIEYNTFLTGGLDYRPSKEYVANTFANIVTRKNIIIDNRSSGNVISVCPDGSNAYHTDLITGAKMTFSSNCYDLPSLGTFPVTIFGNNPGSASYCGTGTTNNAGTSYSTFAGWAESGATETSISFDSNGVPTTTACSSFGMFGDVSGGGTSSATRRKGQKRTTGRKGV